MTATVMLPAPTEHPYVRVRDLEAALRDRVDGEVRFDPGTRGAYSTDASNYRQVPYGVVVPRTVDAAVEAVAVCREHSAPVTHRGGGTSLAGQTCNVAVIIDWSRYCTRVVSVDADRRRCVVEPGIVLDELNRALRPHELMFGPRPATHDHCTLGGMIGNNSCGATAQAYGKTVDNVRRLEVLTYDGERMWVGPTSDDEYADIVRAGGRRAEIYRGLRELATDHADEIRSRFPAIPRRVSGYNLDSLLPENGFDVAQMVVGSEGTLATILRAELDLVPVPHGERLVVLGYPDIAAAADAVPDVLPHGPAKLEGVDSRLVSFERTKQLHPRALDELPDGGAWLMVSLTGDSQQEADRKARDLVDDVTSTSSLYVDDPSLDDRLWSVRESALGATARLPQLPDTWPGWEDSAVAPERLGDYLRDLHGLFERFSLDGGAVYGHFGQGCVHTRIPFDLETADGVEVFHAFLRAAAELIASYGGSLSGEHGDGQARAELLPVMFGDQVVSLFGDVKALFDPANRMNPGKVVDPAPLDSHLRLGADWTPDEPDTEFAFTRDDGSFQRAALRCVGVGKCRRHEGEVMCPSYMVTREERYSTRGRARLLFEMLQGHADAPIQDGWRSTEVLDALDLCLACKGCLSDCPVNVDMATYKAEFLSHHYAGRVRPRTHYALGWLPLAAKAAAFAPGLVNALTHSPPTDRLARWAAGVDQRRDIPVFAPTTLQAWFRGRRPNGSGDRGPVLLWPDTFTNHFHPAVGRAAVRVLEDAGYRVQLPAAPVCCGLTLVSTGQLGLARRVLRRTARVLEPHLRNGTPIVGLEPSCAAALRSDATELLPGDRDIARIQAQTVTLAELLTRTDGWEAPRVEVDAVVQTHCHQHAVLGFDADQDIMRRAGIDADVLDSGCCGLAGDFGVQRGHYEVSQECGERVLFPALRARAGSVVLADGFSCRTQIEQSDAPQHPLHLAELLAAGATGESPRAERPRTPSRASVPAAVGALVLGAALAGWLRRRR